MAPATFRTIDYAVMAAYFAVCAAVGWWAGRGQKDTADYFRASGRMPVWAVCLSILATETSALTFCGVPGAAFVGNHTYVQFIAGSILGRIFVGTIFLSAFFRLGVTTVYEYLGHRFGPTTRALASLSFLATRTMADGVRLTAASIVVNAATGWDFRVCIILMALLTIAYAVFGGIRSIIWTDVVQFVLFVGGGILALMVIAGQLKGGLLDAVPEDKMRWLDANLDPTKPFTLWTALIASPILTFATHGTDQDLAQRMLTCRGAIEGRRSVILSGILNVPMVFLFLWVGTALFAFYAQHPDPAVQGLSRLPDRIFPYFIVTRMPPGVRGLILAAVFAAAMSTLSSAIGALTSTATIDLYKRYLRPGRDEAHYLRASRYIAIGVAAGIVAVAMGARRSTSLLNLGLEIMTYAYGAMLGVFVLGRATSNRGSDRGNVLALIAGVLAVLAIKVNTTIAWPWFIVVGFAVTLALGACFRTPEPPRVDGGAADDRASGPGGGRQEFALPGGTEGGMVGAS